MLAYKVYVLDENGRSKDVPTILECKDDSEAIQRTRELLAGLPLEIWEGTRVIAKIEPDE